MGSLNKVIWIGNLGRDAELRYTPGGAAVCRFSVAATETWTDKQGQRQERTEWLNVDLWGKQAESLTEYLRKGKQVLVEGRLQTDEYTDKEGVKRKSTKVRADRIVLLGGGTGQRRERTEEPQSAATTDFDDAVGAGELPKSPDPRFAGPLPGDDEPFNGQF
jgi:single-strand DNA-binding protein